MHNLAHASSMHASLLGVNLLQDMACTCHLQCITHVCSKAFVPGARAASRLFNDGLLYAAIRYSNNGA